MVGTAQAADEFKGFYVGGYAGEVIGHSDAKTTTVFSSTGYFATTSPGAIATAGAQKLGSNSFTGGGQAGYNFQSGHVLVGLEADFGSMRMNGSNSGTAIYPCCTATNFTVKQSLNTRWLLTARPRIGYASKSFLVYVTGGLAVTNVNYQAVFTDTFATAAENGGIKANRRGFTAGGGIEGKLSKHWSLRGEYLYLDFGRFTTTSINLTAYSPPTAYPTNVFTHSDNLRGHLLRGGLNYRF